MVHRFVEFTVLACGRRHFLSSFLTRGRSHQKLFLSLLLVKILRKFVVRVLFLDRRQAYLKNILICDIYHLLINRFFNNVRRLLFIDRTNKLRNFLGVGGDIEQTREKVIFLVFELGLPVTFLSIHYSRDKKYY